MTEKDKNKQKKAEPCPLCKISEETIKRLKEKEQPPKEPETTPRKKSSGRLKMWLLIFIFGLGVLFFYQFSSPPSQQLTEEENLVQEQSEEKNLGQEQSEEEDQASILDILFPEALEVGDLAPGFVSEDVYGNQISLSDFQGKKPVLLVFWATWCGYCLKELEDLKAFTNEYQDEIQVIAVSSGESKETIKNYIEEKNVNFPMVLDEDRTIWNQYFARGTPSHFLISSQGKIVSLRPGLALREDLEIMMTMLTELW